MSGRRTRTNANRARQDEGSTNTGLQEQVGAIMARLSALENHNGPVQSPIEPPLCAIAGAKHVEVAEPVQVMPPPGSSSSVTGDVTVSPACARPGGKDYKCAKRTYEVSDNDGTDEPLVMAQAAPEVSGPILVQADIHQGPVAAHDDGSRSVEVVES